MRVILCLFLLSACTAIKVIKPIENDFIEVSVINLDQSESVYSLERFSTMADLLALIECKECDLSRFNPHSPLYAKDVIVMYPITEACISLNQADLKELDTLPGIGEALAKRIIIFRDEYGFFQRLEDVMLVKGIKEKLFAKIEAYICL